MKNQKPSDEAIEAAMKYSFDAMTISEIRTAGNAEKLIRGTRFGTRCARILAAALHHEREQTKQLRAQIEQLRDHLCHQ